MKSILKGESNSEQKEEDVNCLWLLKTVKKITAGIYNKDNKKFMLHEALRSFFTMRQEETDSNASKNLRYNNNGPFSNRGDPFSNGHRGYLSRTKISFSITTATVIHHTRLMKVTTNQFIIQIQTHIMTTITMLMKTSTASLSQTIMTQISSKFQIKATLIHPVMMMWIKIMTII